ncbi:hypothetical protein Sjap_020389 [Stephania japonica]|uniref:Uncharacterized protein n=1 Tax=Stephania japonica TaxID=461633 RepID=A0AAP0F0J5_9MAGN
MLTDETLARFLTSHPTRSYSLLMFFDAVQLHDKPELHLQSLRSDFALVAHSFISNNNPNNKLFFCDIEFKHSQSSFSLFSINSLPHIRLVAPTTKPPNTRTLWTRPTSPASSTPSTTSSSPTPASPWAPSTAPTISTRQLILIFLLVLVSAPFLVKRVLEGDIVARASVVDDSVREDAHVYGRPERSIQAREPISVSGSFVKESIELESISSSKPISSVSGSSIKESISRGTDGAYPPKSSTSVGSRIISVGGLDSTRIPVTQLGEIRRSQSI